MPATSPPCGFQGTLATPPTPRLASTLAVEPCHDAQQHPRGGQEAQRGQDLPRLPGDPTTSPRTRRPHGRKAQENPRKSGYNVEELSTRLDRREPQAQRRYFKRFERNLLMPWRSIDSALRRHLICRIVASLLLFFLSIKACRPAITNFTAFLASRFRFSRYAVE